MRRLFRSRASVPRGVAELFQPGDGASFRLDRGDPIVLCTYGLTPGGAERQWIYLAQALGEAGYDVTLLTFTPLEGRNAEYLPLVEELGIKLFDATSIGDLEARRHLPSRPRLARLVEATGVEQPDDLVRVTSALAGLGPRAVFAQMDDPNLLCALGGRLCGIPRIVLSFRNYNPTRLGWIDRPWYLPAYRLVVSSGAVRLTGNSREANADYAGWIGVPQERVHHIPNVIDPRHFPSASPEAAGSLRSSLAIAAGAKVVLGVFRLYPEKDPLTFLEVARRLIDRMPSVRVLVAGDGPMRAAMEEQIAQHGIGDRVTLLGDRKDVSSLMTIADVILMTSRLEGMSNVAVEAQLSATSLVATGIPGIASVVRDGETARLCPAGDADALAGACLELLHDDGCARAMGASARAHALRTFTTDQLVDRYLHVLHEEPTA